ncbi:MAG: hypothetical protein CVU05_07335 [Bacteroidetes bacterium HGW-Bacteroidetes-21]|nr:MAG: hypothetical protein CVU05_07335 [Bacteroidetes bacterium HGW-Bacteroidetes-21]
MIVRTLGIGLFFLFCTASNIFAQLPGRVDIKGSIKDTSSVAVANATVMLLQVKDSALVNFTTTNQQGNFAFTNVKNGDYLLKISHVSFIPRDIRIRPSENSLKDLGLITVYPISELLMEVVIKSAQAPITFKGDTIEYDARLFKVPPGSSVEDLLRRLPGIDVDATGNISTKGENVGKVYVDGRVFFSDDPKVVTKNLDAEVVSKVQVFDEKSEQTRLTGIDDGTKDKVMNIELKDEFKKGYFGKASLGGGTSERMTAQGSYNKFSEKNQFSLISYANNINQTNLNWDEYNEFKGVSAYNSDNGDFGFSEGYRMFYGSTNGFDFDGRGFTENYGGGVNYNYYTKKTSFNASYLYGQTDVNLEQFSFRQTYLTDTSYNKTDTMSYNELKLSHKFSSRLSVDLDSNNTIIGLVNATISGNDNSKTQTELFQTTGNENINLVSSNKDVGSDAKSLNALCIYNHKFLKKGRSFSISSNIDMNISEDNEKILTINEFYIATNNIDKLDLINLNKNDNSTVKSSVMYVEPLSERISIMGFYNLNNRMTVSDKAARNSYLLSSDYIDSLSIYFTQNVLYNRAGTSLNYGHNGLNIALGGAYQVIELKGDYSVRENTPSILDPLNKNFSNLVPYFSANLQLPSNVRMSLQYQYNIKEPQVSQMQPSPIIGSQLFRIDGNADLNPETGHRVSGGVNYWNQASLASFSLYSSYIFYDSQIVYNRNTLFIDSIGYLTIARPENVSGGNAFNISTWMNFPIIKTVLTMNASPRINFSNYPVFINGLENTTKSRTYGIRLGFNLTVGPKLNFTSEGSVNYDNVKYSLQTSQNQNMLKYSALAGVKWQFAKKTYFESNFTFTKFNNENLNFNTNVQLLNISIRQVLGKKNRFEIRLAAIDILNQDQYIRQYASQNYIDYTESPTLARYYMLTVAYNLRGFETKNSK